MIQPSSRITQKSSKPRIIIIGGGIAGCCTALILSNYFQVEILERNPDLLKETSNRWWLRIHTGIHFPHEPERGILTAFCSYAAVLFYQNFLLNTKKPQYYCARDKQDQLIVRGKLLGKKEFLEYIKFLDRSTKEFKFQFPKGVELLGGQLYSLTSPDEPNFPNSADFGVNTNEAVIDLSKLTEAFETKLQNKPSVNVNSGVSIKSIEQDSTGKYILTTSDGEQSEYDYIINTTRHIPINRIDKNFRQSHGLKLPTKMSQPELRLYAVAEDINRELGPSHQYIHGNKGISYAYLLRSNTAIIEALPHTIIEYGRDNDELLSWLKPIDIEQWSDRQAVAYKIFGLAQKEYPALASANYKNYFVAPMIQPSMAEHDEMLKLLLHTPGKDTQIDPTGYFYMRNLKVTDTVLGVFHILQQLSQIHPELGLKQEAETKTPAEFGYWLMSKYPSDFVLQP